MDNDAWFDEVEVLDVDYNHMRRQHVKEGFREGRSAGQEFILQASFNAGFKTSCNHHEVLATYRGCVSALAMVVSTRHSRPDIVQVMEKALLSLEKLEEMDEHVDALVDVRMIEVESAGLVINSNGGVDGGSRGVAVVLDDDLDELSTAMKQSLQPSSAHSEDDMEQSGEMNCVSVDGGGCCGGGDANGAGAGGCGVGGGCGSGENDEGKLNNSSEIKLGSSEVTNNQKSCKLLAETRVAMRDIVLDVLQCVEGVIDDHLLQKIKQYILRS